MSELAILMDRAEASPHSHHYEIKYTLSKDTVRLRVRKELLLFWEIPTDTWVDILVTLRGTSRRIFVAIDGEKVPNIWEFRSWMPKERFFKQQGWRKKMEAYLLDLMEDVASATKHIVEVTKTGTLSSNPNGEQK